MLCTNFYDDQFFFINIDLKFAEGRICVSQIPNESKFAWKFFCISPT